MQTYDEFRNNVLKTHKKGTQFKVRDSQGNRKAYRYIHSHFFPIKDLMTEAQFGTIISEIHKYIIGMTLQGRTFNLPYGMGELRIIKVGKRIQFDNGLKTNMRINWKDTLKLWYEDDDAYNNKVLVKNDCDYIYKIVLLKKWDRLKNGEYYSFIPSRTYKSIIKEHIKDNNINVFEYGFHKYK